MKMATELTKEEFGGGLFGCLYSAECPRIEQLGLHDWWLLEVVAPGARILPSRLHKRLGLAMQLLLGLAARHIRLSLLQSK